MIYTACRVTFFLGAVHDVTSANPSAPCSSRQSLAGSTTGASPYEIHQCLFGYRGKRKSRNTCSPHINKKVKKSVPWTHTFVCLP